MASEKESNGSLFEGMVVFTADEVPSAPPPLHEDLFSDLTLQIQTPLDRTPIGNPPPSRQASRKKKRAVRVGYARDNAVPEEPPLPSPSPSFSALPAELRPPTEPSAFRTASRLPQESPIPCDPGLDVAATAHSDVRRKEEEEEEEEEEEDEDEAQAEGSDSYAAATLRAGAEEEKEAEAAPPSDSGVAPPSEKEDAFGSIEEKLALIRSRISGKLDSISHRAAAATAQRKELRRRQRKVAGYVNSASARFRELEMELEEACEAENFERAERISESLAAAEGEKDKLLIALKDADVECDAVDSEMQEVLELQVAAEEEGATLLQQFAKVKLSGITNCEHILQKFSYNKCL